MDYNWTVIKIPYWGILCRDNKLSKLTIQGVLETQIQLADEKSTIKALRKRQEKDREEMEKLNTELNV